MPALKAIRKEVRMADSQDKADVAEEKQQEPMPGSEESTETNQSQEVVPSNVEGEASEAPAGDSQEELELPKGTKERTTKQFEKLKEQLRQTRDELFQLKDQVPQPKPAEEERPLYDPKTGLVDIEALEQLRRDSQAAKKELSSLKRQGADREVQSLYDAHPEMNPNSKGFNQEAFDEAEKIWLHSQTNPEKYGGQALSQKQAADLASKSMKAPEPEESSNAEEKQQASAEASGKPTQGVARQASEEDLEQLRFGTRTGDKDSMIARMRLIREAGKAS
jgi:hypothetical protein